jgi:hypothetical protein
LFLSKRARIGDVARREKKRKAKKIERGKEIHPIGPKQE